MVNCTRSYGLNRHPVQSQSNLDVTDNFKPKIRPRSIMFVNKCTTNTTRACKPRKNSLRTILENNDIVLRAQSKIRPSSDGLSNKKVNSSSSINQKNSEILNVNIDNSQHGGKFNQEFTSKPITKSRIKRIINNSDDGKGPATRTRARCLVAGTNIDLLNSTQQRLNKHMLNFKNKNNRASPRKNKTKKTFARAKKNKVIQKRTKAKKDIISNENLKIVRKVKSIKTSNRAVRKNPTCLRYRTKYNKEKSKPSKKSNIPTKSYKTRSGKLNLTKIPNSIMNGNIETKSKNNSKKFQIKMQKIVGDTSRNEPLVTKSAEQLNPKANQSNNMNNGDLLISCDNSAIDSSNLLSKYIKQEKINYDPKHNDNGQNFASESIISLSETIKSEKIENRNISKRVIINKNK